MSNLEARAEQSAEGGAGGAGNEGPFHRVGSLLGGRYRIEEQRHAHGEVDEFLGKDEKGGDKVLVRLVERASPSVCARFTRDAEALRKVRHPCLPAILHHGLLEGETPYYVMPFVDGDSAFALAQLDAVELADVVQIASSVASGLHAAHKAGVFHGDIRATNIVLVRRDGGSVDTLLLDFGLAPEMASRKPVSKKTARGLGEPPKERLEERSFGNLPHASPEQVRGEALSERSDVYVLASALYELLTGTAPHPRDADAILTGKVEAPSRRKPEAPLPEAVDKAILAGLSRDPAERPATPTELGSRLWQALAEAKRGVEIPERAPPIVPVVAPAIVPVGAPVAAPDPEAEVPRNRLASGDRATPEEPLQIPGEEPRARRSTVLLAAAAALVLLFAAGWLFGRKTAPDGQPPSPATPALTAPAMSSEATAASSALPAAASASDSAASPSGSAPVLFPTGKPRSSRAVSEGAPPPASGKARPTSYRVEDLKTPYH